MHTHIDMHTYIYIYIYIHIRISLSLSLSIYIYIYIYYIYTYIFAAVSAVGAARACHRTVHLSLLLIRQSNTGRLKLYKANAPIGTMFTN